MNKIIYLSLKIGTTIIGIAAGLIPVWIFFLLKYSLSPEGFWQNLFFYGLCAYFLTGLQILFLIGLIKFLIIVWNDEF